MKNWIGNALAGGLALALASATWSQESGNLGRINDLGVAWPQAENRSVNSDYAVYRWSLQGVRTYQINASDGRVLLAFMEANGQLSRLPFGTVPMKSGLQFLGSGKRVSFWNHPYGATEAAGKCPCGSNVVFDDGYTKIVVTTGSEGMIINTTVISYRLDPKNKTP